MNSQQSRLLAAAIVLCVVYLRVAPTFGQSSLEMEDLFRPAYSPDPLMDMPLPTPEAASLGEYLDRPVGYYTGTPQITVPIYSVTTSSLSLPISLDYKGGGVKVDELATDVGLGWDLTAGGMIARIADPGTPWNQFFMPQPVRYQNGIYPELVDDGQGSTYWTNSTWGQFTPTYNLNTTSNDYFLAIDATDTEPQRTEPEMFSFRFLGRSGTIIRDPNDPNVYYTLPQESLKIETVPGTWNFLITDENGIKYYFEKYADTQAEEDATGEAQPMVPGRTQSFQAYLTKIEAPNGAYISLDYELYRYAYVTHLRDFEIINNFGQTNYEDCPSPDPLTNPLRNYSVVNSQRLVGITAYAVTGRTQNSLIHEAISHVQFTYKATSREDIAIPSDANYPLTQEPQESSALSKIEVFEHGVEKMEYDLSHSYFLSAYHNSNDPYINSLNKRLRLDEVQRVGQPGYTFTYHNANNLPPRLSFAQDKYGYYNGVLSNTNLLPDDLGVGTRTADRSVDNSLDYVYLTTGMLKSVEYPTGGYTEYTFEGNEGGAGARIASIIDYASAAKSEISNELYFEYELATGVVEPIFSEVLDTYYTTPQTPYTQSLCRYTQNMSSALSSLTGRFEDYSVGYGKVTQLHGMDATTGTKGIYGKNVYYFHRDIGTVVGSTTRLGVDFSYKWAKGLPEKNEYFAYENGQFVLVQKEEFEYQVTPERSEVWWLDGAGLNNTATDVDVTTHLPLLVIEKIRPEISNSGYYQPAEFYTEQQKIVTNFQFEAKKVTTGYDTEYIGNDDQRVVSVTEEEFYYNDTYQIPTGSLVTDARDVSGTLVKTSALLTATKHPFDYADPNPGNDNDREDALVDMAALHIWAPAVETTVWDVLSNDPDTYKLLGSNVQEYDRTVMLVDLDGKGQIDANEGYPQFYPKTLWQLELTEPIVQADLHSDFTTSQSFFWDNTLDFTERAHFRMDIAGNLLEQRKANHESLTYIWGWNNTRLVATVANQNYTSVFFELADVDFNPSEIPGNLPSDKVTALRAMAGAKVTVYEYDDHGELSVVYDINNAPTYYTYDPLNRLVQIKDRDGNVVNQFEYNYARPE